MNALTCKYCEETKEDICFVWRSDRQKYRNICLSCKKDQQRQNYYKRKQTNPFIFKHQKLSSSTQQRQIQYNLDPEFLKGIWTGICPIANEEIFISTSLETRSDLRAAELDRFIPDLGYVKGNVTWISREYNMKKQNCSLEDLERLALFMKTHQPVCEASAEITKPKYEPWNKGIKTPQAFINYGENNPNTKLSEEQVLKIREDWSGKRGQRKQIANLYGVSPATISKIIKRITWTQI